MADDAPCNQTQCAVSEQCCKTTLLCSRLNFIAGKAMRGLQDPCTLRLLSTPGLLHGLYKPFR